MVLAGALTVSTLGLAGMSSADAGLVYTGSQIARVNGPAVGLDDIVAVNTRGDSAVAFRRGRVTYVRTRPAGGQWRLALRVAGDVHPAAVTVDRAGAPTVFWHDGRIRFRSTSKADWDVRRAFPGQAAPHLAVDQGAGDAVAAGYLTAEGLRVAYRTATGRWRTPQVLSRRPVAPTSLRVAVDRVGRATVAWVEPGPTADLLRAAVSDRAGRFATPRTVSRPTGAVASTIDLDVRNSGAAVVAWVQGVGEATETFVRSRAADGTWGQTETTGLDVSEPQVGLSLEGGVWVVGRGTTDSGNSVLMTKRTRVGEWTSPVPLVESRDPVGAVRMTATTAGSAFVTYRRWSDDGTSHVWLSRAPSLLDAFGPSEQIPLAGRDGGYSVASGDNGDLVVTVTSETAGQGDEPLTYLYAVAYDATGPVTRLDRPAAPFTRGRDLRVAWRAKDAWSGLVAHRIRAVSWQQDGSGPHLFWLADTEGFRNKMTQLGTNGHTYCFQVRSTDGQGNQGRWSSRRCTAVPLNDRDLRREGGWRKVRSEGSYNDDVLRSRTNGAVVWTQVSTRRVALVATRCPGCGDVDVYLGRRLLRSVSLDAASTRRQVRIPVARFSKVQHGRLRAVVTSSGRRVDIDALATSTR